MIHPGRVVKFMMNENLDFKTIDSVLLVATEIVLPSVDVISDLLLISQLVNTDTIKLNIITVNGSTHYECYYDSNNQAECLNMQTYGCLMLLPILLSTALLIPNWWKSEKNARNRLRSFPFLLCQFWPQYRAARILWWKYKKIHSILRYTVETTSEV